VGHVEHFYWSLHVKNFGS